ncbi:MAG: hypothetical protein R3250_11125, partial [Melioribacteraceae bacterium]|nr:hypothetical protein [Melioribacteraceae bacterium]
MKFKYELILTILLATNVIAQNDVQTFLSLRNTGVESFQNKYPDFDGRGTIILVLDTGVDMGVDGLISTSTGETKVIDIQDFTGQGDIKYFEAELEKEDNINYYMNEENDLKVHVKNDLPLKSAKEDYYIGALNESLWMNSGSKASDMNGNGS